MRNKSTQKKRLLSWITGVAAAMIVLSGCSADQVKNSGKSEEAVKYQEYQNGFELEAKSYSTKCEVDGDCKHTYKCDRSTSVHMQYTGNGNYISMPRTKHRSCPYTTQETTFTVETTMGERVYASNVPLGEPYRSNTVIPEEFTLKAPEEWIEAQRRLEQGEPRGITGYKETSTPPEVDERLQEEYADDVSSLLADNLLPDMPKGFQGAYYAEKAHVIEYEPEHNFLRDIEHVNGALGMEGYDVDVHAVFIDESTGVDPDTYTNSLIAYWQSDTFETNKLADNALVIAIGVDSDADTVVWARAAGNAIKENNAIKDAIQEELVEKPMDGNLFGKPSYNLEKEVVEPSEGIVENILWEHLSSQ